MKRNPNSSRSKKWIERNSLNNESCRRYVEKLCSIMNINSFKFSEYDSEELALWTTYGFYSYITEVDTDGICLKVLECSDKIKNKYHLSKKEFTGDNCWYECLNWMTKRIQF